MWPLANEWATEVEGVAGDSSAESREEDVEDLMIDDWEEIESPFVLGAGGGGAEGGGVGGGSFMGGRPFTRLNAIFLSATAGRSGVDVRVIS